MQVALHLFQGIVDFSEVFGWFGASLYLYYFIVTVLRYCQYRFLCGCFLFISFQSSLIPDCFSWYRMVFTRIGQYS